MQVKIISGPLILRLMRSFSNGAHNVEEKQDSKCQHKFKTALNSCICLQDGIQNRTHTALIYVSHTQTHSFAHPSGLSVSLSVLLSCLFTLTRCHNTSKHTQTSDVWCIILTHSPSVSLPQRSNWFCFFFKASTRRQMVSFILLRETKKTLTMLFLLSDSLQDLNVDITYKLSKSNRQ